MYNKEELFKKVQGHLKENEIKLLESLVDDLDNFVHTYDKWGEVYIDYDNVGNDSEHDPYETFSIRIHPKFKHIDGSVAPIPVINSELSLRELDNSLCTLESYFEEMEFVMKPINESFLQDNQSLCEKIQNESKDGFIVHKDIEGLKKCKLVDFEKQGIDGQLYDLNRLPEVIYTLKDTDWDKFTQRWINDIALINLVKYYYNKSIDLENKLKLAENKITEQSILK